MIEKKFNLLVTPPRVLKANFKDFSPGETVYRHWSQSHLFILVVQGNVTLKGGPRSYKMKAGDIYSIPYAVPREYRASKRSAASIITLHLAYYPWEKETRRLSNWSFHKNGGDFTRETMEDAPFLQPFCGVCRIHPANNEILFKLASQIADLFNQEDTPERQALSRALCIAFIDEFRAELCGRTNHAETFPNGTFSELFHWIEHMYPTRMTTAQIARRARISYTALNRLFKRMTGQSPMNYVIGVRMNQAKQLLIAGGGSIKEIANSVGITNQQYFSRLFRKRYGTTPRRFRSLGNAGST